MLLKSNRWLFLLVYFISQLNFIVQPSILFAQHSLDHFGAGAKVGLSPKYTPVILAGITTYPDDPLKLDFIIDVGDDNLQGEELRKESQKIIKYFMTSFTVPEDKMWVNLSPYEKNRIISDG